jgi:hypothetical protein
MTDEEHKGVVANLTALGHTAVKSLGPTFLMLVLLNVVFLGMMTWLEVVQNHSRERLLGTIVAGCLKGNS